MRKYLLDALFPKTRQAILSACLLNPEKWWYLSDLALKLGLRPSSLQRELASLSSVGILESRKEGNRVYYKANSASPVAPELQGLLIKTAGVADVVQSALKKFLNSIDCAFIYGSIARGEAIATSDIDLMIVGNLKLADLASSLKKAENSLGREISLVIYSKNEFIQKLQTNDAFLKTVQQNKKIFLKGTESELETMVG